MKPVLQRIFSRCYREFVDKSLEGEGHLQRVHGSHPAQWNWSLCHLVIDVVIWNSVDRPGLVGKIRIHISRRGLAFLSADRRRGDVVTHRSGESCVVEFCRELVMARGTIGGKPHIVFTRPDHFHRPDDRLRNQRSFYGVVMFETAAEASAHESYVDLDLIWIEADGSGD